MRRLVSDKPMCPSVQQANSQQNTLCEVNASSMTKAQGSNFQHRVLYIHIVLAFTSRTESTSESGGGGWGPPCLEDFSKSSSSSLAILRKKNPIFKTLRVLKSIV